MKEVTVVKTVNKYESKPVQKLVANDANDFDWAGTSVAMSADRLLLAVGAYGVNERAGAVYLYWRNAGDEAFSSDRVQKLVAVDGSAGDQFGSSVSLSADSSTLAVGAFRVDASDTEHAGAVYLYQRNAGEDVFDGDHVQKLVAINRATKWFGASVHLADSDTLAVGATGDNTGGTKAGAVYIYKQLPIVEGN